MAKEQVDPGITLAVTYDVTTEAIEELRTKFSDVTFDTPANYEVGRKAIATLRDTRGKIEKRRVELKAPALEFGRRVDAAAKHLIGKIEEIEDPLQAAKKLVDDAEAKRKLDAERAELIALEAKQKEEREAAEAKAKAEREAEAKRIAEERAKLAAEQARADEANRAIAEQQRIERQRLEEEKAKLAEQQRAIDEATRKAREATEAQVKREQAEAKRVAAEKEAAAEAARIAEMRPEIEKVRDFAGDLRALAAQAPKLTAPACAQAIEWVCGRLGEIAEDLEAFDGA